jgi:hypothetical protein
MSNELAVLMQNHPSIVNTGLDDDTKAVAGTEYGKRISIKGGVFRLMSGGKEVASIDERHMNVVFVRMAHNPARNFYKDGFVEGAKVSPVCWSEDSKTPHPDVKNPISSACSSCPKAVKGTGQNGKGTACRMSWRTAVVLPNNPSGDVLQLVIPSASIWGDEDNGRWPFKAYARMLAANNVSANRVVTKVQFDTKATAPKLLFSAVAAVDGDDLPIVIAQGKAVEAENAVKLSVYQPKPGDADDDGEEFSPAPAEAPVLSTPEAEPVVRETAKPPIAEEAVSDVVKKWSKKKG